MSPEEHIDDIERYVERCLNGAIPANRWVKTACKRHRMDQDDANFVWDTQKAAEACIFFESGLRHSKGEFADKPFILTLPQKFIIGSVFGWSRADTGYRKYTRGICSVGRKFGKSELASGCALKLGTLDSPFEPGAEVYLVATKEDQVRDTTYKQCVRMVEKSPFLNDRIVAKPRVKSLVLPPTDPLQPNSVIKPIGSDSATSDGFDLSAAILDEMHAWQKRHHELYEKMTTAGGARRQELILIFTTEGNDQSELWISVSDQCKNLLQAIERGERGVADHIFAFLACVDDDDDMLEMKPGSEEFETTIRKSCPNYPITPKPDWVYERHAEALNDPLEANKWRRYVENRRVSSGLRPITAKMWESAQITLGEPEYPVRGAIDLGRSDDFAAWAIGWRVDEEYHVKVRTYTCADRPKNMQTAQIERYIASGNLTVHSGNQIDYDDFEEDVCSVPDVVEWAYDPVFAAQLAQHLQARLGEDVPVKFPQHHRHYNEACRKLVRLLRDGLLKVDIDDDCLAWQAGNLSFKVNHRDEWLPDKGLSSEFKIDGMVALIMMLKLHILSDVEEHEPAIAFL